MIVGPLFDWNSLKTEVEEIITELRHSPKEDGEDDGDEGENDFKVKV